MLMEKLESVLCQWVVLYIHLYQFSYLHAFYKPNNITARLSLKVKSYFQSWPKIFPFGPTCSIKNKEMMEKEKLLQGAIPLL